MPISPYSRFERVRSVWPWLPLWAIVASIAIFSHGPMPLYSTRTLAVAWDMWAHGQWLVPHINGQPYSEKAPLLFWLIHAGWFVFGVSDVWPRVLELLFGAAQLVLLAVLARRLFPARPWVATIGPWMLLALGFAFLFGLQVMYDVLLAVWTLAALVCLTSKGDRAEPRWVLFGLCIGFGLLTKGPVMLLHVAFPWLLGPLWNHWARDHRRRWYGRGVLAIMFGGAMLLAWAIPAGFSGGEAYRQRLFFTQTAGRVVTAFAHARPWYWYVPALPLLLFPFSAWPRMWVALAALRRPLDPGIRFALCWVIPVLLAFSLISGKQLYYPLPEFGGMALLMAGAVAELRERRPLLAGNPWLGTWPLGACGIAFAVFLFVLPWLVAGHHVHGEWFHAVAPYSRNFSMAFVLLGILLLLRGRGELRRLAVAGLVGALALNTLFTLAMWARYDLTPTVRLVRQADQRDQVVAYLGNYEGQFDFAARLEHPVLELTEGRALQDFARNHPASLIVTHPASLNANDLRYAVLVQPFRSSWIVVWTARALADLHAGHAPPEPLQPTVLYTGAPGGRAQR
ncbi:MAG: glycosyltransferase family 39 protein [Rhodanobacter sp.]